MEATVVSVGKAVLDGALGYAKSIVAEEIALQLGVEGDVAFIGDELEMMQSFLMTADKEHDKHKLLLTWVKQVREVAYNVEDNLMDFSVHSDRRPSCWWCIPRALWERRDIAKEVKELRAKVEDVSNRNLRYRLIKDAGSKPTTIAEGQANIATVAMFDINEARRTTIELENSKVDIHQLITNEDKDRTVIAVWGASGDLGKMTVIQEVYEDSTVTANFGFHAWIRLVRPFNQKEFIQSLAKQYYENFPKELVDTHKRKTIGISVFMKMEGMSQSEMLDLLDTKVSDNSYLVVLDNLSTVDEWACIKNYFPDNKKGSRIIVSTQQAEIASLCTEKPHQVSELKQFSATQTLYLFHKKVMPSSDSTMPMSNSDAISTTENNSAMPNSEIQEEEQLPKDEGGDKVSGTAFGKKFNRSRTMVLVDEVLLGRTTEKSKVTELVGQPEDGQGCKVISVWGMGGLGKTTLVQSVYRSPQLRDWKCAWATALRPFNPEQLIRRLAMDLLAIPTTNMALEDLTGKLTQHLKRENCLIVLDDISSTTEWDLIKSCLENARRIIVTTREKGIAKHCSKQDENMYNLSGLKDDIALDVLKKKVFKEDSEEIKLSPDMMEQAIFILKKCDGLPLAISTIGGFLASKPKTAAEWKKTNDRISTELEINPELRTIKNVLLRSYDGLPYHLKSCFLYLSIFPEDHEIKRTRVVQRWVAEGYASEMHGMTAAEVGRKYFDELLDRSMILPAGAANIYGEEIKNCQLHDIMRQICISKAKEENLAFTQEEGCSLSSTHGVIRHLAISSNWRRDKDVFKRILDLSRVRSLTVFAEWRSFFISKRMRFLRVLDLEDTHGINDYHLSQIGELIHIKYLSLRRCRGIIRLPNSLGNLRNLQTLDIRDTYITKLPTNITNLRKLQFLHASGVNIPRGIGKLNALCTLAKVCYADEKGNGIAKGFTQLYQLRKLGVWEITETNSEEFWSAIASLNHLQSLSVNWYSEITCTLDGFLGGSLLPPRSIESLKLAGQLVKLTAWIHHLQNLSRLQLWYSNLQQDAVQAVGKLPNLKVLRMGWTSFEGKELVFEQGSFPSLILLDLTCDFPFVKFGDGTMPKLELLLIIGRAELLGLRYLTKLKEIRLDVRASEDFKDYVQDQLAEHPNKDSISVTIDK